MPKRTSSPKLRVVVKFVDPVLGVSTSITVYGGDLYTVARHVERDLRRRWKTTSLTDRRHKRRSYLSA